MGKHLLLLLLGLSILLDFLQALECHNCSYVNPDGSCQTERNTCKARKYQKCILRKYYEGRWGLRSLLS
ncbi:secreted seminal-vesicle Ly-6 protein 1-like [Trichechus manatus latirostris]|uniref:Secreted seminal-vesicle Ly-6 protein 1-like n=1 Tax=Trichechus manatus latirostris TaxID=127582 RepID=A0A2Y9RJX5_TRIMA|nr:secreted seminal-vesicle Ly-6 protein 1-like [Trichechus manatus latirostris]